MSCWDQLVLLICLLNKNNISTFNPVFSSSFEQKKCRFIVGYMNWHFITWLSHLISLRNDCVAYFVLKTTNLFDCFHFAGWLAGIVIYLSKELWMLWPPNYQPLLDCSFNLMCCETELSNNLDVINYGDCERIFTVCSR